MSWPFISGRTAALGGLALFLLAAGASPTHAASTDLLSGTWQVTRTCITVCQSTSGVLKVVHHLSGDLFVVTGTPPQLLYRRGRQVIVHSSKESIVLTISDPGHVMSGAGVGSNSSTFTTTWRCVAAADSTAATAAMGRFSPRTFVLC